MKILPFTFLVILSILLLSSCNRHSTDKQKNRQADTVSIQDQSSAKNDDRIQDSDTAKVSAWLRDDVLKKDMKWLSAAQRKYSLDAYDLNDDGKNEYFVGFENNYFCGSGGCTYFILNNDGSVNTRFMVSASPFFVLSNKTNGWHDLLPNSQSAKNTLTFNGKSYPQNPTILSEVKEDSTQNNEIHILASVLKGRADYTF